MKKLYLNVGEKIKTLAKFVGILGIVCVVLGLIVMLNDELVAGAAVAVLGLILVLSSLPMYAFGQITEDVREIKNLTNESLFKVENDLPEL